MKKKKSETVLNLLETHVCEIIKYLCIYTAALNSFAEESLILE